MFDNPDEAIDDLLGDKYVEASRGASSWVDEKGNGDVYVYVVDDGWRAEVVDMGAFGDGWSYEVFDADGYCVGDFFVDLFVNDGLIVELKAARTLAPEHLAQTLNYLKITGMPVGLLVNFGSYKFERRTVTLST